MAQQMIWSPDFSQAEFRQMVAAGPQPQDFIGSRPNGLVRHRHLGAQGGAWYIDNMGIIYVYIPWRRTPWLEHHGPLYPAFAAHDTHIKVLQVLHPVHESILDVGGYDGSWVWLFDAKRKVVLDICQEAIERWAAIHTEAICADAANIGEMFGKDEFDVVLLLDVIEHLDYEPALACLDAAERIARNQVIVVTPDGWLTFDETNEAWQDMSTIPCLEGMKHRSGWNKKFFEDRGYNILVQPDQHRPIGGGDGLVAWRDF